MLAGDLAFLAFGPSDFQLHLYGPYISICATCELGYSVTAVWPKQLTVTAQEYFTKRTLGQRKTKRLREKGRVEEWRGRRVQVCLAQISTTLGVVCCSFKAYQLSWGIGFRLKEQHQLIICMEIIPCLLSITLSLSLSVPSASTKCQLYKFKLNHSIVKQCAAHTRSQQRVKLYNLILPFSSFSFPFSFGWGKN